VATWRVVKACLAVATWCVFEGICLAVGWLLRSSAGEGFKGCHRGQRMPQNLMLLLLLLLDVRMRVSVCVCVSVCK